MTEAFDELFTCVAGADGVIFPNYGGRFSFSRAECASIAEGLFGVALRACKLWWLTISALLFRDHSGFCHYDW
jgi:hypothetical protein